MGAKAWSKATPEQRAKHRASCIEAGKERRIYNFAAKNSDLVDAIIRIRKRHGIEPIELLNFARLLPKGHLPLTDEQGLQWREMATRKIPAAEIYQQIFGVTT